MGLGSLIISPLDESSPYFGQYVLYKLNSDGTINQSNKYVTIRSENGEVINVTGNTCPRGEAYGRKECTNPTRIVTSTVRMEGGKLPVVSVKTASDIPKDKMADVAAALKDIIVTAPVHIGDVVAENIAGTGVNMIATRNVEAQ